MAQQNFRVGRLEQEIQREVNDLLLKRIRDPRVEGVTVTGVEVTGDLQQAKIYYSVLSCLLYTSDAADEEDSVDLGGRGIVKKKKDNK